MHELQSGFMIKIIKIVIKQKKTLSYHKQELQLSTILQLKIRIK